MNRFEAISAPSDSIAFAAVEARASFLRKTYGHLAGAIAAFVLLEAFLLSLPQTERLIATMLGGRYSWLIVLGGFMLVSHVATRWAQSEASIGMQYAGLGLFVVAEAILFTPLVWVAARSPAFAGQNLLAHAGVLTIGAFTALTLVVFLTAKDFSFLGGLLKIGFLVALGVIVVSLFTGGGLGLWFTGAMILLACGQILYDTSNVLHRAREGQHVAAALTLFASVALLFWYILRLLMRRD